MPRTEAVRARRLPGVLSVVRSWAMTPLYADVTQVIKVGVSSQQLASRTFLLLDLIV